MTSVATELEVLERRGWEALSGERGAAFYDELMAADGVMIFPGLVLDKGATLSAIADAPPWASYELDQLRVIEPTPQCGIVTYRAAAERRGEAPYQALMTTVYAFRDGHWRLVLHQQTPDP